MNQIFLLLGSNSGNRAQLLAMARGELASMGRLIQASSIYETAAWGLRDQQDFLNQVVVLESTLSPQEVLLTTQKIELQLGRERTLRWGPRHIDIDILFYNRELLTSSDLVIPHPGIAERRFTLVPLCEIAGDFVHPALYKTLNQLLKECPDPLEVRLYLSEN